MPAKKKKNSLSAEEQTRLSWAKRIEDYAAVPANFRGFFESFSGGHRPFPYTVITPTYEGFLHRASEKLLCDFDDRLYILKKHDDSFVAECYPYMGISYVERGTVLLASWLKINGITTHGVPATLTFRFNSVTEELFAPFVDRSRQISVVPENVEAGSSADPFSQFERQNFKLMNYARRSLLPGEKALCTVLQPEIRMELLAVAGRHYYRTLSTAHMTILTDCELIIIREDERGYNAVKYGGIWDFVPLNKIVSFSVSERRDHLLVLTIQLPASASLDLLFQPSMKSEIREMLDRFGQLASRIQGNTAFAN